MCPERRLIVCCDGTWNEPGSADSEDCEKPDTNVIRLVRLIKPVDDKGVSQIVYYQRGVGTARYVIDWILGGMFGLGLSDNIRTGYGFLADNYQPGDQIFLFGFSRGAFTARRLAGMVNTVGLLEKKDMRYFWRFWESFSRRTSVITPSDCKPPRRVQITFIGVWDTVGAYGIPGLQSVLQRLRLNFVGFADSTLPDAVTYGRQALARHEHRKFFVPNIWEEPLPARRKGDLNAKPTSSLTVNGLSSIPRLKQVWFDGAHSNVGGGYDRDPLAFLSLTWMVNEAEQCGLGLDTTALQTEVVSAEKNGSDGKGYLETCIRHPFWSFRLQFMAVAAALTAFALVLPAARTVLQAVVLKGLHAVDYVMIRATLPDIVWSPIAHHPWIAAIWIAWILSLFVQSSRRTKLERALHTQIHWSVYDRGRPPDVPNRKYEPTGNMKSYYQAGGEQPTSIAVAP